MRRLTGDQIALAPLSTSISRMRLVLTLPSKPLPPVSRILCHESRWYLASERSFDNEGFFFLVCAFPHPRCRSSYFQQPRRILGSHGQRTMLAEGNGPMLDRRINPLDRSFSSDGSSTATFPRASLSLFTCPTHIHTR